MNVGTHHLLRHPVPEPVPAPGRRRRRGDHRGRVVGGRPREARQWEVLARARALDSTSYVLACGQADPVSVGRSVGTAPTGIGHSLAVDPLGEVIGSLGADPDLLVVDLDPGEVAAARLAIPVLANRRV